MWVLLVFACTGDTTPTTPDGHTDATGATAVTGETASSAGSGHTGTPETHTGTWSWPRGPANVLLVLIDDIGVDKIGAYGETTEVRTPVIDALAAEGMLFRQAWASPVCSPSRAQLETGRFGHRTGYGGNQDDAAVPFVMGPGEISLAELVDHAPGPAWSTALLGKWHLNSGTRAELEGWDLWAGTMTNLHGPHGLPASYYLWAKWLPDGRVIDSTTYATTDTADDAIAVLSRIPEPWLVHVAFNAAHDPFEAPPAELHTRGDLTGADVRELERAMVEAMDAELGRVLAALTPEVRARTVIVVAGDNGTPIGVFEDPTLVGGKLSLLETGVRVPLIVVGPQVHHPGVVSDALVQLTDVFPTVADIAGVDLATLPGARDPDGSLVVDGRSLLPVLADETAEIHDTLYTEVFQPNGLDVERTSEKAALRDHRYKLIHFEQAHRDEFYEIDPVTLREGPEIEEAAMTADQRAARDRLRAELDARLQAMADDVPFP